MGDYIAKAMALSGQVRVYSAVTTKTVEHARVIHNMYPTPAVALGRVLTGAALMSQTLKSLDHTITIQIKGDGPIGGIVAVTDAKANVRGYVHNPYFDLPLNDKGKFDIKRAVGSGYLNVIQNIGLKEPYIGYVDLVSGEIAEDLTYYYAYSEQIPTAMNLGVLIGTKGHIEAAGGYFIQLMPNTSEEVIDIVEKSISKFPSVSSLIKDKKTPEEIISLLFPQEGTKFFEKCPVNYVCNCSRERMGRNLISLGKKDLMEIAQDEKGSELVCHFCGERYHFSKNEILDLIAQSVNKSADEN
jgi:molecular chaperone Hsp33